MSAKEPTIPEHVAAYAAGLYHSRAATWGQIARVLEQIGLGTYRYDKLARAALAWARLHVTPAARREIARLRKASVGEDLDDVSPVGRR